MSSARHQSAVITKHWWRCSNERSCSYHGAGARGLDRRLQLEQVIEALHRNSIKAVTATLPLTSLADDVAALERPWLRHSRLTTTGELLTDVVQQINP
jgi:hypothetical protein